ncbi:diguanylate cyclase, partial [Clostridium saudiense]|nr:diguanylate cyclase [Clostridium saudiense]
MNSAKIDKSKQINDIVSTVKLASLLFTGIILFKYVFVDDVDKVKFHFAYYELISFLLPLIILLLIYFIWTFSTKNKLDSKYNNLINKGEIFVFILLFSIIIYISGANESNYKFLYLFIIITTTIQSGIKYGLVTSIISSIIILAIDLFMMPATEVNIYFENDLILAGIFILTAWPLGFYVKIEGEHIKKLENIVNFDGLTNVYNHRYFQDKLKEKIE